MSRFLPGPLPFLSRSSFSRSQGIPVSVSGATSQNVSSPNHRHIASVSARNQDSSAFFAITNRSMPREPTIFLRSRTHFTRPSGSGSRSASTTTLSGFSSNLSNLTFSSILRLHVLPAALAASPTTSKLHSSRSHVRNNSLSTKYLSESPLHHEPHSHHGNPPAKRFESHTSSRLNGARSS